MPVRIGRRHHAVSGKSNDDQVTRFRGSDEVVDRGDYMQARGVSIVKGRDLFYAGVYERRVEVRSVRLNLRRMTADKDDKRVLKAAVNNPESSGLNPWREVLQPHDDVATGNFHASEFAADLYKVATGGEALPLVGSARIRRFDVALGNPILSEGAKGQRSCGLRR